MDRDLAELIAQLLIRHKCGPECGCWKLAEIPEVREAVRVESKKPPQGVCS